MVNAAVLKSEQGRGLSSATAFEKHGLSNNTVASCEINATKGGVEKMSPTLRQAVDNCIEVRKIKGDFTKWSERSLPVLRAALNLIPLLKNEDAVEEVMAHLKRGRERAPNKGNTAYLAVLFCSPGIDDQKIRKECSRFASVVRAAIEDNVTSDSAEDWLSKTTLTQACRMVRGRCSSLPQLITKKKFPHLVSVMSSGNGELFSEISTALQASLTDLNAKARTGIERKKAESPAVTATNAYEDAA